MRFQFISQSNFHIMFCFILVHLFSYLKRKRMKITSFFSRGNVCACNSAWTSGCSIKLVFSWVTQIQWKLCNSGVHRSENLCSFHNCLEIFTIFEDLMRSQFRWEINLWKSEKIFSFRCHIVFAEQVSNVKWILSDV